MSVDEVLLAADGPHRPRVVRLGESLDDVGEGPVTVTAVDVDEPLAGRGADPQFAPVMRSSVPSGSRRDRVRIR